MLYGLGVLLNNTVELFILAGVENNLVHNIEVCLFAHGLNLRDYLSDEALLDKLGGEVRVDSDGDAVVGDREAALLLDGVYEQVVNAELYFVAVDAELQRAIFVKLLLCGRAVEGGEMLFYLAEESAVFRADGLELRLEAVADEIRLAVNEFKLLYVELVSDYLGVLAAESLSARTNILPSGWRFLIFAPFLAARPSTTILSASFILSSRALSTYAASATG